MPSVLYKGEYKPINYFLYGFVTFIALYCHTTISYFANLIKYPFHQSSVTEVKKKWSDIKLDVKRRLAKRRRGHGPNGRGAGHATTTVAHGREDPEHYWYVAIRAVRLFGFILFCPMI